jgi:hypothetical protein
MNAAAAEMELIDAQVDLIHKKIWSAARDVYDIINPRGLNGKRVNRGGYARGMSIDGCAALVNRWLRIISTDDPALDPRPFVDAHDVADLLQKHGLTVVHAEALERLEDRRLELVEDDLDTIFGVAESEDEVTIATVESDLVTFAVAAERLGVSVQALHKHRQKPSFPPPVGQVANAKMYSWREIFDWYRLNVNQRAR